MSNERASTSCLSVTRMHTLRYMLRYIAICNMGIGRLGICPGLDRSGLDTGMDCFVDRLV